MIFQVITIRRSLRLHGNDEICRVF